jgi:hypothetical protein
MKRGKDSSEAVFDSYALPSQIFIFAPLQLSSQIRLFFSIKLLEGLSPLQVMPVLYQISLKLSDLGGSHIVVKRPSGHNFKSAKRFVCSVFVSGGVVVGVAREGQRSV